MTVFLLDCLLPVLDDEITLVPLGFKHSASELQAANGRELSIHEFHMVMRATPNKSCVARKDLAN